MSKRKKVFQLNPAVCSNDSVRYSVEFGKFNKVSSWDYSEDIHSIVENKRSQDGLGSDYDDDYKKQYEKVNTHFLNTAVINIEFRGIGDELVALAFFCYDGENWDWQDSGDAEATLNDILQLFANGSIKSADISECFNEEDEYVDFIIEKK